MKRTPLKPGKKPLSRKTPLRAKTGLKTRSPVTSAAKSGTAKGLFGLKKVETSLRSRSPIRARSKKREREDAKRSKMKREILEEARGFCAAYPALKAGALKLSKQGSVTNPYEDAYRACRIYADDVHEPLTRARGGSIIDKTNAIPVCRDCHNWIHGHPALATALGLLRSAAAS